MNSYIITISDNKHRRNHFNALKNVHKNHLTKKLVTFCFVEILKFEPQECWLVHKPVHYLMLSSILLLSLLITILSSFSSPTQLYHLVYLSTISFTYRLLIHPLWFDCSLTLLTDSFFSNKMFELVIVVGECLQLRRREGADGGRQALRQERRLLREAVRQRRGVPGGRGSATVPLRVS